MGRKLLSFLAGIAVILILAEVTLHLLPVSTATKSGYHHDPDLITYPSHHRWRMAAGWDLRNPQTLTANNWGFAAEHDFNPDPNAVALIGDSYVEASMLDATDRPASQLQTLLGGTRKVYAMGTPGTALLDYAQRIRVASEKFQVQDVVLLLERFDARQAVCGSGNVVSRCLDAATLKPRIERLPPPSPLTTVARHSALAQYMMSQLRFKPAALVKAVFTRSTPESMQSASSSSLPSAPDTAQVIATHKMVDAVVDEFFANVADFPLRRLVVVLDGRRSGPAKHPELVDEERAYLIRRLREHGAIVHDMEPRYAEHASTSSRSLDVGPYDAHLNALGVRLVMTAAATSLLP